VFGVTLALAIGRILGSALYLVPREHSGMLYGVKIYDPLSMVVASVVLLAVLFLASFLPARRAMRVDSHGRAEVRVEEVEDATGALAVHDSAAVTVVVSLGAGGSGIGRRAARPPRTKNRGIRRARMTQEEAHRRARLDLDGIEQTKEKCGTRDG